MFSRGSDTTQRRREQYQRLRMRTTAYTAVVAGASGATGRHIVQALVDSPLCTSVSVLVRSLKGPEVFADSAKVKQVIVDYENINRVPADVFTDATVAYSALGTTRADAGSAEAFTHIDYGYNMAFARRCHFHGIQDFHLISSQGANKNSWLLYPQSKGRLEADIGRLIGYNSRRYDVYRPGLLVTPRDRVRFLENILQKIVPDRFSIPTQTLGRAVVWHSEREQAADEAVITYPPRIHEMWEIKLMGEGE